MARREFQMPSVHKHAGPNPYWYIRYRVSVLVDKNRKARREKWHMLGRCDEMTKREALRLRDDVMRSVNRQVYTIQSHIPFEDFVDIYKRQHIPTLSAGAQKKNFALLQHHIVPALSNRKLCDVDREAVQVFLNTKKEAGLAWWTRNDLKSVLSSIFTKAQDWGYWNGRNPTARTGIGHKQWKRERRILSDDEFRRLLGALPADVQLMVSTTVSTGMRVSEVLGLKWRNVDLGRGLVWVRERYYRGDTDEPKTGRARRALPLGRLVKAYRRHKPDEASGDGYVFQKDGEPLDDRAILKDFIRPAAKRLGSYFTGFGWHSFRRQNLTRIQELGATTFEAQAQAGHSNPAMTSDYTIVGLERRRKVVLRLQKRLLGKRDTPSVKRQMCGNSAGIE